MKTKNKLEEKKLSKAELEAREKVIKDLKKNKSALVKRYGKDAEAVMYGRATNIAKKMAESENKNRIKELVRKALMQEADIEVMADKYGEEKALGQAAMMLDALEELLKKHDWWYMMSDDNRAYTEGSAKEYEIRKIMKELEAIGYGEDAKELFNKYAPDGPGGTSLKMKEAMDVAKDMTTQETSGHAERFAKYMSDKEGKTFTVTAGSVDGPSFDLDLDGKKYDGGSYIISKSGDIVNMALPGNPVYANTTMLEGKKEDMDKDGDIDSKDYLLKRDAAIKKAKGEMKEAEKPRMFVTGGNINPELVKKVEQFVKGVAKYYDYSVDDAFLAIMTILKGGIAKEGVNGELKEDWGGSDQYAMNQSIHKSLGNPTEFPGLSQVMNAAEDAVDFYWNEWPEYKTDRDGLIMYATQKYANKMFPEFMAGMRKMFAENLYEDIDLGHKDNEPHMIKGELYQIGKYAMKLYATLEELEETGEEIDFPAWWQSKITTAKNMMSGAKHYLDFELKEPYIDAAVDAATGEASHMDEPEAPMMNEDEGAILDQVRNELLGLFQPYGDFQILDMTMKGQNTGENFRLRAKSKGADWKGLENFMRNNPDFNIKHISKQTFDNPKTIDFSYKTSMMNEDEVTKIDKLAAKIAKALNDPKNKSAEDQENIKQARKAMNNDKIETAEKIIKPYLAEKIAKQLKSK